MEQFPKSCRFKLPYLALILLIVGFVSMVQTLSGNFLETAISNQKNSYDPSKYGIPDTLAGYRVLGVRTPYNTACMVPGTRRIVLQAMEQDVQSYLNDSQAGSILDELRRLGIIGNFKWFAEIAGPNVTKEQIIAGDPQTDAFMEGFGCKKTWVPIDFYHPQ